MNSYLLLVILMSLSAAFAYINYKVVTGSTMPIEYQPKRWLRILSWVGIIFLGGFSLLFLVWRFGQGLFS